LQNGQLSRLTKTTSGDATFNAAKISVCNDFAAGISLKGADIASSERSPATIAPKRIWKFRRVKLLLRMTAT
jgi:hypothetical protein